MATTTYAQRFFFAIPDNHVGDSFPSDVYAVTGSSSYLIIDNGRGDLSNDNPFGDTPPLSDFGWWAGINTSNDPGSVQGGIIVAGNQDFSGITGSDNRPSKVSVWGFVGSPGDQNSYDADFIATVNSIFGTSYSTTGSAKNQLQSEGYYYQYPQDLDGQSPNTGDGSD